MVRPITFCSVPGCSIRCEGRGLCIKHYQRSRYIQRERVPKTTSERFWRHVNKTETCWLWTGGLSNGYGHFAEVLNPQKTTKAHRYAYELLVGPIPEGLHLDHLCRVPACVNPDHLEPVTPRINVMRSTGPSATFAKATHCVHGHPFDEANTRWTAKGRRCRTCDRRLSSEQNARAKAAR